MSKLEDEAKWAALASLGTEEAFEEEEDELLEEGVADGSVGAPSVTIVIGGRSK